MRFGMWVCALEWNLVHTSASVQQVYTGCYTYIYMYDGMYSRSSHATLTNQSI